MSIGNPDLENLEAAEANLHRIQEAYADLQARCDELLDRMAAQEQEAQDQLRTLRIQTDAAVRCIQEMIAADSMRGVQVAYARWKGPKQKPAEKPAEPLSSEEFQILDHTVNRAAGGRYCGGSHEMNLLLDRGYMEYAGTPAWAPDSPFYTITATGRKAYREAKTPKLDGITTFPEPDMPAPDDHAARAAGQDVTRNRNVGRGHG